MSIISGIQEIGKFITDVEPTYSSCTNISEDFTKMGEFFAIFGDGSKLLSTLSYNLLWHFTEIWTDISQSLTYWDANDFYNFGVSMGEALVLALNTNESTAAAEVPQRFF